MLLIFGMLELALPGPTLLFGFQGGGFGNTSVNPWTGRAQEITMGQPDLG